MRLISVIASAAALLAFSTAAQADDPKQIQGVATGADFWGPMTFSLGKPTPDGRQKIFAVGSIDNNTADVFQHFIAAHHLPPGTVVAFHSPGGDIGEGIEMGLTIRQDNFDTTIGQPTAISDSLLAKLLMYSPGVCASSCSIAFLGGVSRAVPAGSLYGVHDTYLEKTKDGEDLLDLGQKIAGDITLYLNQMGVDPRLLTVLSRFNSSKGEVFFMPSAMMAQLNVTTTAATVWALRDTQWGFGLEGRNTPASNLPGSSERVVFACTGTPRHMVIGASYLPEAQLADGGHGSRWAPGTFASLVMGYTVTAVNSTAPAASRFVTIAIAPDDVVSRAHLTDAHIVTAFVKVTPALVGAIRNADSLSFRFNSLGSGGSVIVDFAKGRAQAMQLIQNCR